MKKMISIFGSSVLSREQMKKVSGGLNSTCTVRCYNAADELLGSIDCASSCTGGDDDCRNQYEDFDNATCNCS